MLQNDLCELKNMKLNEHATRVGQLRGLYSVLKMSRETNTD